MKIILTDNLDRDESSEQLLAENVSVYWGQTIVSLLNTDPLRDPNHYFRLVKDSHKLRERTS